MKKNINEEAGLKIRTQKGYKAMTALLDAGLTLMANEGIHQLAVSTLCKKAGVNRTSFYAYFETPEQFLAVLAQREIGLFETEYQQHFASTYDDQAPGLERLVQTLWLFFKIARHNEEWGKFVFQLVGHHDATATAVKDDLKADIKAAIAAEKLGIKLSDTDTYTQLLVATMTISPDSLSDKHQVNALITMLLNAGKLNDDIDANVLVHQISGQPRK